MARYRLTDEVHSDIADVWAYIARDDVGAANRVLDEVYQAFQLLANNPGIGHAHAALPAPDLRVWRVHSYLVIYRAESDHIQIVRVVSGYRDLAALFGPNDRLD